MKNFKVDIKNDRGVYFEFFLPGEEERRQFLYTLVQCTVQPSEKYWLVWIIQINPIKYNKKSLKKIFVHVFKSMRLKFFKRSAEKFQSRIDSESSEKSG